jgi:mRNA interferase MazF
VKRGDLVTIALPGDFGKPRPALIIQSDQFDQTATVTVLLVSGTLVDAPLIRTPIEPTPTNGLRKRSQVMVDKAMSVKRDKIGGVIGRLAPEDMLAVTRALAVFFAIT